MDPSHIHQQLLAAVSHHQAGRLADAETLYRQVLAADPQNVDALHLLGVLATQSGHHAAAADLIQQAVTLRPTAPEPHYNLGCALQSLGKLEPAEASFRRAIVLKPDYLEAHNNLGDTLRERMVYPEAEEAFRHAIALDPNFADAWTNLGVVLNRTRRQSESIACHQRAIALQPNFATAHNNLGNVLMDCGYVPEALDSFRRAQTLPPHKAAIQSNLLLTTFYDPSRNPIEHFHQHQQWADTFCRPLRPPEAPYPNDRDPDRRLRIGYVSPDFYHHSVRFFFEPLLSSHHAASVETFCYANVSRPDDITARLREQANHWLDITSISDEAVVQKIRDDQIDILVDLAGHTANNRIRLFAHKPAPIQASYLGYLGSPGLETIDYRLTDRHADPPNETDPLYVEKLLRLPDTFACFHPEITSPPISPPPALANGFITFGVTNMLYKISPAVLHAWSEILLRLPTARLLLITKGLEDDLGQSRIREALTAKGIASPRLTFQGKLPLPDYLAAHRHIDILLDTFPINGHTVTCNSLWMGVPVITLAGKTYPERIGASVLHTLNFPEWIAHTPADYVNKALALANDIPHLASLRNSLRTQMQNSPLMNASRFATQVEDAYRSMWHQFLQTPKPHE